MKFNLDLFKQVLESDVKDLGCLQEHLDVEIDKIDDEYLATQVSKFGDFVKLFCDGNENSENMELFWKMVLIKYAYHQGLKDGGNN